MSTPVARQGKGCPKQAYTYITFMYICMYVCMNTPVARQGKGCPKQAYTYITVMYMCMYVCMNTPVARQGKGYPKQAHVEPQVQRAASVPAYVNYVSLYCMRTYTCIHIYIHTYHECEWQLQSLHVLFETALYACVYLCI